MAQPRLLRDRTRLTRLLILRELLQRPDAPLREVAAVLDVTPQAVSTHVAGLEKEGLVEAANGRRSVTPTGVQRLQEGFRDVKRTVDEILQPLSVIGATSAVARSAIRAGERVGLFMEKGVLVARAGDKGASTGRAVLGAMPGEEVLLRDLQGVVDLEPGTFWVIRVPGPEEGGSGAVNVPKLRALLDRRAVKPERVGVEGTGARVLAAKLNWKPDLEFAAVRASFHAAQLGLDVALLVSQDVWSDAAATIEALNRDALRRVSVETLEPPVEARPVRR